MTTPPSGRPAAEWWTVVAQAARWLRGGLPAAVLAYAALFVVLFSPAWLRGILLAPGDAFDVFVPNYESERHLLSPFINAGFRPYRWPESMAFYPPALFGAAVGLSYNGFVILAFVIASVSSFLLVRRLTGSTLAAAVSGTIYGMSGFFTSRIADLSLLHTACWCPLVLLGLARLATNLGAKSFVLTAASACLLWLGGSFPVASLSLVVAFLFALVTGDSTKEGRRVYLRWSLLAVLLGFGLASVQLIPAALDLGDPLPFDDFVENSIPSSNLFLLLFPQLFGGHGPPFPPYAGPGRLSALSSYVGLVSLMLAFAGAWAGRRARSVLIWTAIAVVALLVALGDATPLARLADLIPFQNRFETIRRHLFAFVLAVSILAGYGVTGILSSGTTQRVRTAIASTGILAGIMLMSLVVFALVAPRLLPQVVASGTSWLPFPWQHLSIGLPVLVLLLGGAVLLLWSWRPAVLSASLLVAVVALDLASFGIFAKWRYATRVRADLEPPPIVEKYGKLARSEGGRIVVVQPGPVRRLPLLWRLPLVRRAEHDLVNTPAPLLDMLAVRYAVTGQFFTRQSSLEPRAIKGDALGIRLGPPCAGGSPRETRAELPDVFATHIGQVSSLWGAAGLRDGAPTVELALKTENGSVSVILRAGQDTGEWAWDRPDVRPIVQHARPAVYHSAKAVDGAGKPFGAHQFVSVLPLGGRIRVRELKARWVGPLDCHLGANVHQLAFQDAQTQTQYTVPKFLMGTPPGWRLREAGEGYRVYENASAMPLAWVLSNVRYREDRDIAGILRGTTLPAGTKLDLTRTAFVEVPVDCCPPGGSGVATILEDRPEEFRIRTSATADAFLVVSKRYFPGWRAWIGETQVPVFRVSSLLLGVRIPSGTTEVRFRFEPTDLETGKTLTFLSLVTTAALGFTLARRGRKAAGEA